MKSRNMVADTIRALRHGQGYTQMELARKAGVPRATLALMESPEGNPSLHSVVLVAQALGVPVGELLHRDDEETISRVRPEEMPVIRLDGGRFESRMLSPPNNERVQLYALTLQPGCDTRGRSHSSGSQEYLHGLGGEWVLTVNDQSLTVHTGDLVYFAGGQPHSYANTGNEVARALVIVVAKPGDVV